MKKFELVFFSLFLAAVFFVACSKNPVTGKREIHTISQSTEMQLGQEAKKSILKEYGLYVNPQIQEYVDSVGKKLIAVSERKDIPYEFVILDTPMVNAFAVPGVIFLTRGILDLMQDEAELASVMGHEMGHVNGYHTVKILQKAYGYSFLATLATVAGVIYSPELKDSQEYAAYYETLFSGINLIAGGFLSGYGRELELEADRSGLRYAILAGYDPDAMISFFKRMEELEKSSDRDVSIFMRTHPHTPDRIVQTEEILEVLDGGKVPRKKKEFKQVTSKVAKVWQSTSTEFVDNYNQYQDIMRNFKSDLKEDNFKIEDRTYKNLGLGLALEVPLGWTLEGSYGKSLVQFRTQDGKARGELQIYRVRAAPQLLAKQLSGGMAGIAYSTSPIAAKDWGTSIEKHLGFGALKKRTEREFEYENRLVYNATYYGSTRIGDAAFYKIFFQIRKVDEQDNWGIVLICSANADKYLNYLVDFDYIFKSLKWKE